MLSAEALRLAAIEVLCPTAANVGEVPFPTRAGKHIYDSSSASVNDLDEDQPYTPVLYLYSSNAVIDSRADAADEADTEAMAVLEIVGDLAVVSSDETGAFVGPLAGSDPEARIELAAMMAQVRFLLEFSQVGGLFRRLRIGVRKVELETFALPEVGLRWQRMTMKLHCAIPDDTFGFEGGLPDPIRSLFEVLPEQSYARVKLAELAAAFAPDMRPPLAGVAILGKPDGDPIASTGALT